MKLPLAIAVFLVASAAPLVAQTVQAPIGQNADIGAYNATPQTCTTGKYCQVQTDINGNLKVVGSSTPISVQEIGAATFGTSQIAVTSSGVIVVAARTGAVGTGRKSVCVTNITGTSPVYISGTTPVTTSNGMFIAGTAGAAICLDTQSIVYGIVPSGNQTVSYSETY